MTMTSEVLSRAITLLPQIDRDISGYSHHTLCCSVAASCGSDLCSTNYSKLCYFAIYLHGESLSEQLTNAIIQLRVRSKLHQRQQRLKHLHRLPNAITTLVILNPLLPGYGKLKNKKMECEIELTAIFSYN